MSLNLKSEALWISIIFLAAVFAFYGSLRGEFVYDDRRQIVANPLIQEHELFGKALTSDVWAFKGDGTIAASNYWRPVFTAWCISCFAFFGLNPFGWHLVNLLLHLAFCILAYLLLRRLDVSQKIALVIAIVLAVHPVQTESVVWISGAPATLFGFFLILAFLFADFAATRDVGKTRNIAIAVIFYLLALGSKETAVLCAPLFALILGSGGGKPIPDRFPVSSLPFFAAAIAYFAARWIILGELSHPVPDAPDLLSSLLSVPETFVFYLGQIVWPDMLGPNYSLRPVERAGLSNFALPLIASVAILFAMVIISKGSRIRSFGTALFILPLVPAFFITAFLPDQIVHDRYLYVPLLGILIVIVTFMADGLKRKLQTSRAENVVLAAGAAVSVLLLIQTINYRTVWTSEIALWRHAVTVDEGSASNWLQLGATLSDANDFDEAAKAYQRSIEIKPSPLAVMGSGRVSIALGNFERAVKDLESVITTPPQSVNAYTLFQTYEALAVAYQQQKNYSMAERRLREARERLPIYRAALTDKLAVILYLQGRKNEALTELESSREQARLEMVPGSKLVIFRLGALYGELSRTADARDALQEFVALTVNDVSVAAEREQAVKMLQSLR